MRDVEAELDKYLKQSSRRTDEALRKIQVRLDQTINDYNKRQEKHINDLNRRQEERRKEYKDKYGIDLGKISIPTGNNYPNTKGSNFPNTNQTISDSELLKDLILKDPSLGQTIPGVSNPKTPYPQTPGPKPSSSPYPDHRKPAKDQGTDLGLGKSSRRSPDRRSSCSDRIAELGKIGNEQDLKLLKKALECVEPLAELLERAGYKVIVARNNIANTVDNFNGRKVGGATANDAEGVHRVEDGKKEILVRTYVEDGCLKIDLRTLLHEIGHAAIDSIGKLTPVDPATKKTKNGNPTTSDVADIMAGKVRSGSPFQEAYEKEHKNFYNEYFHTPSEFAAEAFMLYISDPKKLKSEFPLTYRAFKSVFQNSSVLDHGKYKDLFEKMNPAPDITCTPEIQEKFRRFERRNNDLKANGQERETAIIVLEGEKEEAKLIAKSLGNKIVMQREGVAVIGEAEGFIEINAQVAADYDKFFNMLKSSKGAVLYVEDLKQFGPGSEFMERYESFCKRHLGWCHLVLAGDASDLKDFDSYMPECRRFNAEISLLNPDQTLAAVKRAAANDGYTFSVEAGEELVPLLGRPYSIKECEKLWKEIKVAQNARIDALYSGSDVVNPNSITWVLKEDIYTCDFTKTKDPLQRLDEKIGLDGVKDKIRQLIAGAKINKIREEQGLAPLDKRRLNMLWSGHPGTGKTSVAELVAEILAKEKITKNSNVLEIGAAELMEKGVQFALQEFKKAKGGVIFIDEFHQLDPNNNTKGKPILDVLIPMLTSREWEDTVFICAGYPKKLANMLKADEGLRSRFEQLDFEDFTKDQMREIAVNKLDQMGIKYTEEVLSELLERVDKLQRASPFPGNARDVVKTIEKVTLARDERIAKLDLEDITADKLNEILVDDVKILPKYTAEDVLREVNENMVGNEEVKELMNTVYGLVQRNRALGNDLYKDIPMAIAIDGPAGTGKNTTAEYIMRLYYALDLLPADKLRSTTGGKMVGGFVGNSSALAVEEKVEEALGGCLFIDEVSSMTNAHEFSKQSVKELLTQMVDNKKRLLVIVADYPGNVDKFMGFDEGVPRRFDTRVSTEKLNAENAENLFRKLAKDNYDIAEGCNETIRTGIAKLVSLRQFASAGDIVNLASHIGAAQVKVYQEFLKTDEAKQGKQFDWKVIDDNIMKKTFDEFIKQVEKRPVKGKQEDLTSKKVNYDVATKKAEEAESKKESAKITSTDVAWQENLAKVNQQFKDIANSDPQKLMDLMNDPQSEYYEKLAKETNTTREEAYVKTKELEVKFQEIIREQDPEQELRFDYVCPFCNGSNSSGCHYFSNSQAVKPEDYLYNYAWLITNSLKKPYFVQVEE